MGGLVPFSKIAPGLVGSFVAAYFLDWLLVIIASHTMHAMQ